MVMAKMIRPTFRFCGSVLLLKSGWARAPFCSPGIASGERIPGENEPPRAWQIESARVSCVMTHQIRAAGSKFFVEMLL